MGDLLVLAPQTSELRKEYKSGLSDEKRCSSSTFMLSAQCKILYDNLAKCSEGREELGYEVKKSVAPHTSWPHKKLVPPWVHCH